MPLSMVMGGRDANQFCNTGYLTFETAQIIGFAKRLYGWPNQRQAGLQRPL